MPTQLCSPMAPDRTTPSPPTNPCLLVATIAPARAEPAAPVLVPIPEVIVAAVAAVHAIVGIRRPPVRAPGRAIPLQIVHLALLAHAIFDELDKPRVQLVLELRTPGQSVIEAAKRDDPSPHTRGPHGEQRLRVEEILFFQAVLLARCLAGRNR